MGISASAVGFVLFLFLRFASFYFYACVLPARVFMHCAHVPAWGCGGQKEVLKPLELDSCELSCGS